MVMKLNPRTPVRIGAESMEDSRKESLRENIREGRKGSLNIRTVWNEFQEAVQCTG
jgi:hypothetical protein